MTSRNHVAQAAKSELFRVDYQFLRSWGYSHAEIAERLGVKPDSLDQRVRRLHCWVPTVEERAVLDRYAQRRAKGRPFMAFEIGNPDSKFVQGLLAVEVRKGRLSKRRSRDGELIFTAIEQEQSCSA